MQEDVLMSLLKKAFDFAKGEQVYISFQGGEPLIAGKKFFLNAFELIEKLNAKNSPTTVALQTNGTLIDEEWCNIFASHKILVGVSLDGDEKANKQRVFSNGNPSFDTVVEKIDMLKNRGVDYNVLTVITKQTAQRIEEIYAFFKKKGYKYIQYIPCLKPLNADTDDYALSGEEYGDFLIKAFNLYAKDYFNDDYVSVRIFDNFVQKTHGNKCEQCGTNGHCTHQYVIESDGTVYPCDFFCTDEHSLGNITNTDFSALEKTKKAVDFIKESLLFDKKCLTCKLFALCKGGGCKREKLSMNTCTAYKKFFPYAYPIMRRMY